MQGFFVAYTRNLLERVVPRLQHDAQCGGEVQALNRSRPLLHPVLMRMYPSTHPRHPAQTILLEDVFLACLVFVALAHLPVTLLDAKVSEWTVHRGTSRPPLIASEVYHKLRSKARFAYIGRHRDELLPRVGEANRRPRCSKLSDKMRSRGAEAVASLLPAWQWCE